MWKRIGAGYEVSDILKCHINVIFYFPGKPERSDITCNERIILCDVRRMDILAYQIAELCLIDLIIAADKCYHELIVRVLLVYDSLAGVLDIAL